uniref:Uncharacterized protein n=1 Tax=Trichobilharzia regenti TaxID=157069 RepID=A0AA85IVJ8_TRIRE|nr:unnamed protein product [Trichobilharzia regenti]
MDSESKKSTVPQESVFLRLQFIGDVINDILSQDILPCFSSSMYNYQFNCPCQASYIGRKIRQVHRRISEHLSSWSGIGLNKTIRKTILVHLVDTGYQIDTNKAFKVIYRVSLNFSCGLRIPLLHAAEAIGIHLKKANPVCSKEICAAAFLTMANYIICSF